MQTASSLVYTAEGGTACADDFAAITPIPDWVAPRPDDTINFDADLSEDEE